MFARDHFHPSGAGYGRAMAVLLPALISELDVRPVGDGTDQVRQLSA